MFFNNQICYNAPWHDLKRICVGSTYPPEFYEPIKNSKVKDQLQLISQETTEDYDYLISVLSELGVDTIQVPIDINQSIMDYVDNEGRIGYKQSQSFTLIPRPPMQPRDSVLIVGDQVFLTNSESQWFQDLSIKVNTILSFQAFDASLVTVVGDSVIADCRDHPWLANFLQQHLPDRKVIPVTIGGHNDAVFSVVAPGIIVSTYHHTNYTETFPGWEIKFIENQSWNAVPDWRKFKHSNKDRWWVPGSMDNREFSDFVDTWLNNWVGFVAETVFDINMLQINRRCVLVNNFNSDLFEFFQQHGIEPIVVPFRHRFFWDGGLHCITNDLYRDGPNEKYI